MFTLLIGTCGLTVRHFLHCLFYSAPAQAFLALALYLLFRGDSDLSHILAAVAAFLASNTLFTYSAARQLFKHKPGHVLLEGIFRWRREHNDFFIFITLGIIVLSILSVYFIDAVDFLLENLYLLKEKQAESPGRAGVAAGSYSALALGSRVSATALMIAVLLMWRYVCCIGIRIPAYIDGYYLRAEEAMDLTRASQLAMMLISFFCIISVTTFADIIIADVPPNLLREAVPLIWAFGYYIVVLMHLALWVSFYNMHVKRTSYHMARLVH